MTRGDPSPARDTASRVAAPVWWIARAITAGRIGRNAVAQHRARE